MYRTAYVCAAIFMVGQDVDNLATLGDEAQNIMMIADPHRMILCVEVMRRE
jgi:hypothetical protein